MAKYSKLDAVGGDAAKVEFSTTVEIPVFGAGDAKEAVIPLTKNSKGGLSVTQPTTSPTPEDKNKGRCLQGRPTFLEDAVGERLATEGLAAKTDEGWVRGHKWHMFYKV